MTGNQTDKINTKLWWQPANLKKSENIYATIDELNEVDTGNDFGSYKYMLRTNDIIGSQIKGHNDINPIYRVKMLKGLLGDFTPKQIIDAGCGLGFTTKGLKRVFSTSHVTGIDISTDAIAFAKTKFPQCSFLAECGDPDSKDQVHKADLICCFEFYPFTRTDEIKEHRKYLKHLLGWLNEGGKLVICQLWDNEESLSINFEALVAELSDYNVQSYCMPIRKIGAIIQNRKISVFLSKILIRVLRPTNVIRGISKLLIIEKS